MRMNHPCAVIAVLALAGLALPGCSDSSEPALATAAAAHEEQNYHAARDAVQAVLRANPEDRAALELLARIHLAMGNGLEAEAALERLEAAGGAPADGAVLWAEARLQQGDAQGALARLGQAGDADAARLRALARLVADDEAGARAIFAGSAAAPGPAAARARLHAAHANFLLDQGDVETARTAVAAAQEAGPQRLETLFATARLAAAQGDRQTASRAFLAILERAPYDRPALIGAIDMLAAQERYDLVEPLIARGRAAYPGDIAFVYLAARLAGVQGRWAEARDLLQRHESQLRDQPEIRRLYAEALLQMGQAELARSHLAPLHRSEPDNAPVARLLARAMLMAGDAASAARVIAPFANGPGAQPEDREIAARAASGRAGG